MKFNEWAISAYGLGDNVRMHPRTLAGFERHCRKCGFEVPQGLRMWAWRLISDYERPEGGSLGWAPRLVLDDTAVVLAD
jgi:hypothetical protein